jgi:hypothetical protein
MGGGTVSFGEFLEYVEKYDSGKLWKDVTYKNYDLLWQASDARLRRALALCRLRSRRTIGIACRVCHTCLRARVLRIVKRGDTQCLLEWYVWRGLERGSTGNGNIACRAKGTNVTAPAASADTGAGTGWPVQQCPTGHTMRHAEP